MLPKMQGGGLKKFVPLLKKTKNTLTQPLKQTQTAHMKFLPSESECLSPKTYNLICHMPIL